MVGHFFRSLFSLWDFVRQKFKPSQGEACSTRMRLSRGLDNAERRNTGSENAGLASVDLAMIARITNQ